jgi:formylglycine-generating enzyme required for sulfatase activity
MKRGAAVALFLVLGAVSTSSVQSSPPPVAQMALIPAGSFRMGDSFGEGSANELPVHTVYVSAFTMDCYEVTKGLWDEVAGWAEGHGYDIGPADGYGKAANHPVVNVSWYEAVKWANARSEKEGLTPSYTVDGSVYRTGQRAPNCSWITNGYRLPTEAEWEKAARGGAEGHRFPWSDTNTIQHARANYFSDGSYSYDTSPTRDFPPHVTGVARLVSLVGSLAPNAYGLYDMAGNVWEWCWDWYGESYYVSSLGSDPRGPASGSDRVSRGGCFHFGAYACRVAYRISLWSVAEFPILGFRLVRAAP